MTSCIICHMNINIDDIKAECSSGHEVHEECLSEWLVHSPNCPMCNNPYPEDLITKNKEYIEQKERAKKSISLNRERNEKIKKIAEKFVLLKFIDEIDRLAEKNEFDAALDKLFEYGDKQIPIFDNQTISFLKGKVFYLQGRYDLAIGNLFKLVKEKYDYPDAFQYLGKSYEKLGMTEKAIWAFDRAGGKD